MTEESPTYPLVSELIRRSRLPWYWATAAVTALLLVLLLLATYLDGVLDEALRWPFWRDHLSGLLLIAYILGVQIPMLRLRHQAIQSFRPLLGLDDDDFDEMVARIVRPNRR